MSLPLIVFYLIVGLCSYFTLASFFRWGRPVSSLAGSMLWGLGGLGCVYMLGLFTGPLLPVNMLTIGVSSLYGLPGVIGILLLKLMYVS